MTTIPRAQTGRRWVCVRRGFTLIELLVVVAIIAVTAAFLLGGANVDRRPASLRSAQATLANLITLARTRAGSAGQASRILLQIDPVSTVEPQRYLHYLVAQVQTATGWETITDCRLSPGIYVVPGNFAVTPDGLFFDAARWVRADGVSPLRSTALRASMVTTETINATVPEQWVSINFSVVGSTAQSGDIVLATGVTRSPGTYSVGDSRVELGNPEAVRGLTLSSYGVTALIENRLSF